ncbi:hypothetical protein L1D22_02250 [Vibrio sp. Isolate34]|uniref:hypothetical protein n=1 Tax=Vibrio sp. Isolate34 TaxID=2908540 RepID=UPI001EFC6819|nr:hypothetical protein [Vibrio sp. Isolate34]MCG9638749.1 hypothetical protein [Vibrio sp. Isolate34]
MNHMLVNWYKCKHPEYLGINTTNELSAAELQRLAAQILQPIEREFGKLTVTYGYTSHSLLRWILKNSPGDMASDIDQHASMELNSKGKRICKRDGAACDFYIEGYETRMDEVAKYICTHLAFDRLYFYGKNKPIHISIGPENNRYALIRQARSDGLRVNMKSANGSATQTLFDDL